MVSKRSAGLCIGLLGMVCQTTQNPAQQNTLQHDTPQLNTPRLNTPQPNTTQPNTPQQNTDQQNKIASPEDPPVSSSRVRLSDGRYLAYTEKGVPRNKANHKIIVVHGFGSSKEMSFQLPQEVIEELGIYFLLFDRAGYGESDPNPKRSLKSEAFDIQELADQLCIGPKFYLIGVSMGSCPTWGCIKYIPERLAGVSLVVPVVNYRWRSLPEKLIKGDYRRTLVQLFFWFAKHIPRLLQWWVTQDWNSSMNVVERKPVFFSNRDTEALKKSTGFPMLTKDKLRERVVFDALRDDFLVCFGNWEFDPTELSNPFPQNENSVQIWQGYEDKVVPFQLQRHISGKLPWIKYYEVPDGGHLLVHYSGLCEAITRALLLGEENPLYIPSTSKTVP
ncbi:hypothetical protein SLA2020_223360 [Shorea laevis]